MCNKIGEELIVSLSALRVVLDGECKGIISKPHLLDDVVGFAPGFDFEPLAEAIHRLVMRAVNQVETMARRLVGAQWLDILLFHLRRVMTGNVEVERTAERDVH